MSPSRLPRPSGAHPSALSPRAGLEQGSVESSSHHPPPSSAMLPRIRHGTGSVAPAAASDAAHDVDVQRVPSGFKAARENPTTHEPPCSTPDVSPTPSPFREDAYLPTPASTSSRLLDLRPHLPSAILPAEPSYDLPLPIPSHSPQYPPIICPPAPRMVPIPLPLVPNCTLPVDEQELPDPASAASPDVPQNAGNALGLFGLPVSL
ncbi:hypothetical protein K439DRAFT_1629631 [Ramaria rubella]|nr:hypothetical protein K439DRAFT_1629631 [Ramaria rubella]